jgi:hypothetical protein
MIDTCFLKLTTPYVYIFTKRSVCYTIRDLLSSQERGFYMIVILYSLLTNDHLHSFSTSIDAEIDFTSGSIKIYQYI